MEIGLKLRFESISHILARDYSNEKDHAMVNDMNPMNYVDEKSNSNSKPRPTMNMMRNFGLL